MFCTCQLNHVIYICFHRALSSRKAYTVGRVVATVGVVCASCDRMFEHVAGLSPILKSSGRTSLSEPPTVSSSAERVWI